MFTRCPTLSSTLSVHVSFEAWPENCASRVGNKDKQTRTDLLSPFDLCLFIAETKSLSLLSPDVVMGLFLFNPFTIASCISGSTSSLEMLCVLMAVHRGVAKDVPGAAFAVAAATYVGLHPLLLMVSALRDARLNSQRLNSQHASLG